MRFDRERSERARYRMRLERLALLAVDEPACVEYFGECSEKLRTLSVIDGAKL